MIQKIEKENIIRTLRYKVSHLFSSFMYFPIIDYYYGKLTTCDQTRNANTAAHSEPSQTSTMTAVEYFHKMLLDVSLG